MLRTRQPQGLWAILIAMLGSITLQAAEPARPLQQHVREFDVIVDGSRVGSSRLEVTEHPEGRTVATTDTQISIRVLFFTYVHRYRGSESWHAGQPRKLDGQTQSGTDERSVRALLETSRSEVSIDGDAQPIGPAVHLTTSFWYWPTQLDKLKALTLLNVDDGQMVQAECEKIGAEVLVVGTQKVNCTHYRLKGGSETDLWFDEDRLLVLRKGLDEGHRTELRLLTIKREEPQPATAAKDLPPKL